MYAERWTEEPSAWRGLEKLKCGQCLPTARWEARRDASVTLCFYLGRYSSLLAKEAMRHFRTILRVAVAIHPLTRYLLLARLQHAAEANFQNIWLIARLVASRLDFTLS